MAAGDRAGALRREYDLAASPPIMWLTPSISA
jgi:hypothetical protein